MPTIKIPQNTTAIDVGFNLSGSLTGFPAVLFQLPVGERIGFDTLPKVWEDVNDVGQTWTPELEGKTLDLDVPVYNTLGADKAPYTTDLFGVEAAVTYGQGQLRELLTPRIAVSDVPAGFNLRGKTLVFTQLDKDVSSFIDVTDETMGINGVRDVLVATFDGGDGIYVAIGDVFTYFWQSGEWLQTFYMFPSDKDYIVYVNNLPPHTGDAWGFDYAFIVG